MKKVIFLALSIAVGLQCAAQFDSDPNHLIGLRTGMNYHKMLFSHEGYKEYEQSMQTGLSFGIYSRHRLMGNLHLRADAMYNHRATKMNWDDVKYSINAYYLDFRFPFQYIFQSYMMRAYPYIYAGPSLDITTGGNILYTSTFTNELKEPLSKNNFASFDIGILAGVGVQIPLTVSSMDCHLSLEAGVDIGLMDTFSKKELDGDVEVANPELSNTINHGTRKNLGFEAAVILSIPLNQAFNRRY